MILVFDLDDTLYDELQYVRSGFRAVANYLSGITHASEDTIAERMWQLLQVNGRGRIFNDMASELGIKTNTVIKKCLSVYRSHNPSIQLYPDAEKMLTVFRHYPKYIVTDGNKIVQRKKMKALKTDIYFKKTLPTHQFGIRHAKPSPYVFHRICKYENALPSDVIYFGDNPLKDFMLIKKEGFKTVRLLRGQYAGLHVTPDKDAHISIYNFKNLNPDTLQELFTPIFNKKQ